MNFLKNFQTVLKVVKKVRVATAKGTSAKLPHCNMDREL
jgi:hypothetical protein